MEMDKFLLPHNWFFNKYYPVGVLRYSTFKSALNLFLQRGGETIVETGTCWVPNDWGSGLSTLLFGEFCQKYNKKLITIDIENKKIEASKEITKDFASNIEYIVSDSVEFLKNYKGKIDFLYLDSYDYPYVEMLNDYGKEQDQNKAIERLSKIPDEEILKIYADKINPPQEHCLNELKAAYNKLTDKSIILMDDYDMPGYGKPRLANEFLVENGWECVMDLTQILFIKKRD